METVNGTNTKVLMTDGCASMLIVNTVQIGATMSIRAKIGREKMIKYENECVSCADAYPCIHCKRESVKHFYCDGCGDDVETLYIFDDGEYCADCVLDKLEVVE